MAIKSKKGRKIGRNTAKCARYLSEGRREKNRDRRVARIVKGFRKETPEQ